MGRYKLYLLTLFSATLLACNVLLVPSVQPQPAQIQSTQSFVDSIGVNTHLNYTDTAYGKYDAIIKPRFQESGILHIRDGLALGYPEHLAKVKDLASLGIRFNLVTGPGGQTFEQAIALAKGIGSAMEAVEGPNEYDIGRENLDWGPGLREYEEQLHAAFRGDPATAQIQIVGPSFVDANATAKAGDLSQWVDYGNMHPYNYPNYATANDNLDKDIANRSKAFGKKPLIATEVGYHTANASRQVSEVVQAKYLTRMFLEHFNRGVFRTFSYEFIDEWEKPEDQEANFGILRNDGSPKPAFTALKNLITLLKDPGDSFPLKSLNYTLKETANNVHHTLLQKRDGRFYLILWQEVSSFDSQANKDLTVPDRSVTLTLNTTFSKAVAYQPLSSVTPTAQYTNPKELSLKVPDHPLVLELVPLS